MQPHIQVFQDLKQEFLSGSKITQAKIEDLIDSSINKVDDLSIDANGNVGIGTSSPSQSLHVTGDSTGNAGITVENKGTGKHTDQIYGSK